MVRAGHANGLSCSCSGRLRPTPFRIHARTFAGDGSTGDGRPQAPTAAGRAGEVESRRMNPFTRHLLEQSGRADLEPLAMAWDGLEALVIRVYRAAAAGPPDEAAFAALRSAVRQHLDLWAGALEPAGGRRRSTASRQRAAPLRRSSRGRKPPRSSVIGPPCRRCPPPDRRSTPCCKLASIVTPREARRRSGGI